MQQESREFLRCHFEFRKLNILSFYLRNNNKIIHVNAEPNHPPSIIKQLPNSIELKLPQLSANEEIFKNPIIPCNEALTKAGYKQQMRYQRNIRQNTNINKIQKRNIIWFSPTYSANVVTKVGKHFLSLLDKHFHLTTSSIKYSTEIP